MLSDSQRLELASFRICVMDPKIGVSSSNLIKNQKVLAPVSVPKGLIYELAREVVEAAMLNDKLANAGILAS